MLSASRRVPALLLAAVMLGACLPAGADLIPPEAAPAALRLHKNPKAFDRVDNFCKRKRVGDACSIPGGAFAGGGEGMCRNDLNRTTLTIDLSCVREGQVTIDRKLPAGGFVNDSELCSDAARSAAGDDPSSHPEWNCTPTVPTAADQFCTGKAIGSACTVELTYQGRREQHQGVCSQVFETEHFYYQGRRTATRQVIRCDPATVTPRSYAPATWWQKLTQ